jgi:hypothetical protein
MNRMVKAHASIATRHLRDRREVLERSHLSLEPVSANIVNHVSDAWVNRSLMTGFTSSDRTHASRWQWALRRSMLNLHEN